jgi:hypothetical protein
MSDQEKEQKKLTMQETIRKIEMETEAKLIDGYKTGKIQMPTLSADGKTLEPIKNGEHQIDILKNIIGNDSIIIENKANVIELEIEDKYLNHYQSSQDISCN